MMKLNMKLIAFAMTVASLTFGSLFPSHGMQQEREDFKVVFIAYENPDQLIEDTKPVVEYLEKKLNRKVTHFIATNYGIVVEALKNGSADMGFMGPLQYVIAHDQAGARPILGEIYSGKPTYVSRVYVRKDSGIKTIADLQQKSMAFIDPISSSGYLYPLEIFVKADHFKNRDDANLFFRRTFFAGGDEQGMRAVYNGFVDAVGVGQYAFNLLKPEEREEMIWIAESAPIPSHCVVVGKDVGEDIAIRLQSALLELNEGPDHALLKNLYNVDGYVKVNHETYKDVETIALKYGFIKAKK